MSVEPGVSERLAALTAAGTSVWLDQIRRTMITSGKSFTQRPTYGKTPPAYHAGTGSTGTF